MWHIETTEDEAAAGALRELYDQDLKEYGYVWNTSRVWSQRPETGALWKQLQKEIRSHLRLRTYELATLAAARAMDCVYCMLAHGEILTKNGFTPQQVIQLLEDYHHAGLPEQDVHLMDFATKVSSDPDAISPADVDILRKDGLTDQQVTDVTLAVTARNFISRLFMALGADPDPELIARQPELWGYLMGEGSRVEK